MEGIYRHAGRLRQILWRNPMVRASLAGVLGAILFVWLFSPLTLLVGPFTVRVGVAPYWRGETQVVIPPIGRVFADTHPLPLRFTLELENIDIDQLRQVVATERRAIAVTALRHRLELGVGLLAGWVLFLGLLGGAAGAYLILPRQLKLVLAGAMAGLSLTAAMLGATYGTYRWDAFAQPQFEGILKAAPWAVSLLDESFSHARIFSRQLTLIADNLYRAFSAIDTLEPVATQDEVRVLLVSDIHNNPLGLDFVQRMATAFQPRFIVDAGDLTDYGTEVEAKLMKGIADLDLPYLFVPGNHDSPVEIATLLKVAPNVKLLSGDEITLDGVAMVGLRDPSSYRQSADVAPPNELIQANHDLRRLIKGVPQPPLLVVVHNPRVAENLVGQVPVIVVGHLHRAALEVRSGTLWLNPGTTGAAGIRGYTTSEEVPYSLMLLHLVPQGGELVPRAVDEISLSNLSGTTTLVRKLLPDKGPNAILKPRK